MSGLSFTHRFVPAPAEKSPRTLLLLHGTGGNENDLLPLGRELDPAAALLSPRGKILENGMPRFFRRLAEGLFDEEDVIQRSHELAEFVASAAAHYRFDLSNLIAVGYSNGANIAAATMLLHPGFLRYAILLRAMVPLIPAKPPALGGTQVLICEGTRDPIVEASNAERLAVLLRDAGADVRLRFEDAGHELVHSDLEAAKQWLTQTD